MWELLQVLLFVFVEDVQVRPQLLIILHVQKLKHKAEGQGRKKPFPHRVKGSAEDPLTQIIHKDTAYDLTNLKFVSFTAEQRQCSLMVC